MIEGPPVLLTKRYGFDTSIDRFFDNQKGGFMRRMSGFFMSLLVLPLVIAGCSMANKMNDEFLRHEATAWNYFDVSIINSKNTKIEVGYNFVRFYANLGYAVREVTYFDYDSDGVVDSYQITDLKDGRGKSIVDIERLAVWNYLADSYQKISGINNFLPKKLYAGKNLQKKIDYDYKTFRKQIGMNRVHCAGPPIFSTGWGNVEYPIQDQCLDFYKRYYNIK